MLIEVWELLSWQYNYQRLSFKILAICASWAWLTSFSKSSQMRQFFSFNVFNMWIALLRVNSSSASQKTTVTNGLYSFLCIWNFPWDFFENKPYNREGSALHYSGSGKDLTLFKLLMFYVSPHWHFIHFLHTQSSSYAYQPGIFLTGC